MRLIDADALYETLIIGDIRETHQFCYPCKKVLEAIDAQPEIIRCNVCRHWHQTTGEMKGFGLGDCDYLEKKLVTCNGYCYWAERKEDGQ